MTKKRSITSTLFFYTAVSITVIFGSLALHMIFSEIQRVNHNVEENKIKYIESKKSLIKSQVNLAVDFINYEKEYAKKEHKDSVQKTQNKILEQIAGIRFNSVGYIFVVSYDGTTLMNDVQRELIGENHWNITDPDGVRIVQEERKAVENPPTIDTKVNVLDLVTIISSYLTMRVR